jgi:hypothetical protein
MADLRNDNQPTRVFHLSPAIRLPTDRRRRYHKSVTDSRISERVLGGAPPGANQVIEHRRNEIPLIIRKTGNATPDLFKRPD